MTESHEQTEWPCLAKSLVPMIQGDLQHEVAHGYATNVPPECRDNSRLPPSSYMYGHLPHSSAGGYLTQPHGVPKVISNSKLLPSIAPVLPNAHQTVSFPNPLYRHETAHDYATNVPPVYRDHPRLSSLGCMYGPSVGMEPGYQIGYDGYQHPQQQPLWSIQPLQHEQHQQQQSHQQPHQQPQQDPMFTMGDPQHNPHLTTQMSTTPSHSPVRPGTNTHGYVNISPASTTITAPGTVTVGTFSNNGRLTSHESSLQVPRKISHGCQNVTLTPVVPEQKQYSDSQLKEQMQAINLEAASNATGGGNAHIPPPMSNHPSYYSPVTRSKSKSLVPLLRRDLKSIQPKDSSDEDSSDDFELYGWKVEHITPMSSQPSSLAANSDGRTLTGPPHEEETIDKPDSDNECNEDGDNIGVLTLPGDPLLSDSSDDFELYGWKAEDVTPMSSQPSNQKFH